MSIAQDICGVIFSSRQQWLHEVGSGRTNKRFTSSGRVVSTCDSCIDSYWTQRGFFGGARARGAATRKYYWRSSGSAATISYPRSVIWGQMLSRQKERLCSHSHPECRLTIVQSRLVFLVRLEAKLRRVCCSRGWKLYAKHRHCQYKGCSGM